MNMITNHMPTAELQALDAAHHVHPFTNQSELAGKGARVITRATGVTLTDSEGNEILDAMAGLWCVNIGYGRDELADVAARAGKRPLATKEKSRRSDQKNDQDQKSDCHDCPPAVVGWCRISGTTLWFKS